MKICSICGITDDMIRFRKERSQCLPCYNDKMLEYSNKYYKKNRKKVRSSQQKYREENREKYNRQERIRYRKLNGMSPLSYRVLQ